MHRLAYRVTMGSTGADREVTLLSKILAIIAVVSVLLMAGCAALGTGGTESGCEDDRSCAGSARTSEPRSASLTPKREEPTRRGKPAYEEECPDGGACVSKNYEPVPSVVGLGVEAACRELKRFQYSGTVFFSEDAGGAKTGRVAEQIPEAGARTGVDAPVYLGLPAPLPERLPPQTSCPRRDVIQNLPANFPSTNDE